MTGYYIPLSVSGFLFILSLLVSALHLISGLLTDELVSARRDRLFLYCFHYLLALIFAALSFEWLLLIASVEGGLFLPVFFWHRYLVCFPPVLYFVQQRYLSSLSVKTRPEAMSYFVALLLLPVFEQISPILSMLLFVFAAAWLFIERTHFLISYLRGHPVQTAQSALPQIFNQIRQGLCIASSRGWILEGNPAFYQICAAIGISKPERVNQIETEIDQLSQQQKLRTWTMPNGLAIECGEQVFLLRRNLFRTGRKKYTQLSLSDVTQIHLASRELAARNQFLEQQNLALNQVISQIEQETLRNEKDKICRAAHDHWSQRMAVAGLSLDQLMNQKQLSDSQRIAEEIITSLESDLAEEVRTHDASLETAIETMTDIYKKIGVTVFVKGQASFTRKEEEVISAVVKEGFANAVRHAYAKMIQVTLFTADDVTGIRIENDCIDDHTDVQEGRGLYDMKQRVIESGGQLHYSKKNRFILQAVFPKIL